MNRNIIDTVGKKKFKFASSESSTLRRFEEKAWNLENFTFSTTTAVLVFVRGVQSMKSIIDDNRYKSRPIDINQDQLISINRLILIINDQSFARSCGYLLLSISNNNP